jgi:hypothetical protein
MIMAMTKREENIKVPSPSFDITNFFSIVISRAIIITVVKICKESIV